MKIRIILADDHVLLLEGLEQCLSNIPDFEVVGTATNLTALENVLSEVNEGDAVDDSAGHEIGSAWIFVEKQVVGGHYSRHKRGGRGSDIPNSPSALLRKAPQPLMPITNGIKRDKTIYNDI